jgi:pyruvate carboxylase
VQVSNVLLKASSTKVFYHLLLLAMHDWLLQELSIRGDIRTTVEYIVDLMRSSDFVNNTIDTAWLDARILSGSGTSSDTGNT